MILVVTAHAGEARWSLQGHSNCHLGCMIISVYISYKNYIPALEALHTFTLPVDV